MAALLINAETINGGLFAPFGGVVAVGDSPMVINNGYARKHAELALVDAGADGLARMHLFAPKKRTPPIPITMMERHPAGAQCFMPLGGEGWLALVGDDCDGAPDNLYGFSVGGDTGLCYDKNIWHFPLLALTGQRFVVVDNGAGVADLEEYYFDNVRWLINNNGVAGVDGWKKMENLGENKFMDLCGGIAEESPWVARGVWDGREALALEGDVAMGFALVVLGADDDMQLQLIKNHPQLATAKKLSDHSAKEQTAAGLSNLSAADNDTFAKLNDDYYARFGFPFVCAVAGMSAADILMELQRRTNNAAPNADINERAEALYQIFQIIRLRLHALQL